MTQNLQNSNYTAASRHCKQNEAIQQNTHFFWIAAFFAMMSCSLVSCEKEIEFNGEQIDPKLVVNSVVEPGQPVKAYIGKSIFFLDNEGNTQAPDDLVATLYVNGNRIGELTRQPDTIWTGSEYVDMDSVKPVYKIISSFVSNYCPNKADLVKITASANGFDDVEGVTSPLPNNVEWGVSNCETIYWESSTYEGHSGDSITSISAFLDLGIEISDPNPGQIDYFRIGTDDEDHSYGDGNNAFGIHVIYDDPVFGATVSENDYIDINALESRPEGVFTDQLFDGRSYLIKLRLYVYLYKDGHIDPSFFQAPIILEHLGKEYYYYLNTCEQGDEIMQFFSEPVQTYTNVTNGYGIVGGCSVDTLWLDLPIEER